MRVELISEHANPPAAVGGVDARLNQPEDVAATVVFALGRSVGCEIGELVVCPSTETSWP
ncbi:hypothetical protein ACQPYK_13080 [Streptosporangium sp. CA-135522]|uniref:hypothetical protein n=1 Tax=Streptosporangium sp. CA-135522 TaxID=3240072 RepID=UPI003D949954